MFEERSRMIQYVFSRTEKKYLLTPETYKKLLEIIEPYLEKDKYFKNTNCSLYFDDDTNTLAVRSLEKPLYKEKVRLRSYGVPTLDDTVFLEIKKKYDGVGGKRRISVKLSDFYAWDKKELLLPDEPQISEELGYLFESYKLEPKLYLAYDRTSYYDKNNPRFRVTFDQNVRSRQTDLFLEHGDRGEKYFKNGEVVMEVKAENAYPLWFVKTLSLLKIYPTSFSKYGRVMQKLEKEGKLVFTDF
jgi:SPX domain protein involved in polyphosphate accumulation